MSVDRALAVEESTRQRSAGGAAAPGGERVDASASSLRFVYPFTFDAATLADRAAAVDALTWQGARQALTVWRRQEFRTADLLSHVAGFLAPPPGAPLSAALWRMDDHAVRAPAGLGGGAEHPGAEWTLVTRHGEIPFALQGVELALFRHGVGFLTVQAEPRTDSPAAWFDFIHHFRFVAGERGSEVRAERRATPGTDGSAMYFPPVAGAGDEHRHFGDVIDGLLRSSGGSSDSRWWEEIFVPGVLLPYASVYIDDAAAPANEMLFRLRNFFHHRQDVHPAAGQHADAVMEYSERQWFFFSLNGGGFLAVDAPPTPFFRQTLPAHIAQQYFLLFLLALLQRFVLMMLSQEVATRWVGHAGSTTRAAAFARIHEAMLAFTAQGYFAQTMQEEHHHRYYERWLETFQVTRLYDQVAAEVRDMHADLDVRERQRSAAIAERQERQTKLTERRLNRIGFLIGVPIWLFVLLNSSVNVALVRSAVAHTGPSSIQWYDLVLSLVVGVCGLGLGIVLYRLLSRSLRR